MPVDEIADWLRGRWYEPARAAKRNIRVNCVCPGVVDTPLVRKAVEAAKRAGQSTGMPATIMAPTAIANAVVSLIKDDSMSGICA